VSSKQLIPISCVSLSPNPTDDIPAPSRLRAKLAIVLGASLTIFTTRTLVRIGFRLSRSSIPTALIVYICPVARRKYVFSDFLLLAVARGLAAGNGVMREGECNGESFFLFPPLW
jgi:hypothetical protein